MDFASKMLMLIMKKGTVETSEGIATPNQKRITILGKYKNYKHQTRSDVDTIKHERRERNYGKSTSEVKEKISKRKLKFYGGIKT